MANNKLQQIIVKFSIFNISLIKRKRFYFHHVFDISNGLYKQLMIQTPLTYMLLNVIDYSHIDWYSLVVQE